MRQKCFSGSQESGKSAKRTNEANFQRDREGGGEAKVSYTMAVRRANSPSLSFSLFGISSGKPVS